MNSGKTKSPFHHITNCLNPKYHPAEPNFESMVMLQDWFKNNGYSHHEYESNKLIRVAQLCEFGGVMWKTPFGYGDTEKACGTWALCPVCHEVMMCGYNDNTGLGPKRCDKCRCLLRLQDYFQPIYKGGFGCPEENYCREHKMIHHPETMVKIRNAAMLALAREKSMNVDVLVKELQRALPNVLKDNLLSMIWSERDRWGLDFDKDWKIFKLDN